MSSLIEIRVPDLGDFDVVEVIEVLVQSGATISENDPLITLETDKAAMDVPSPSAGTVAEVRVAVGDKVSKGDLILMLQAADSAATAGPATDDSAATAGPATDEAASGAQSGASTNAPAESAAPPPEQAAAAPAAASASAEPQLQTVTVPDLGDFAAVEVIEVHAVPGAELAENDPLLTLETDKAAMDVPAPFAGTVQEVLVSTGGKVSTGDAIVTMLVSAAPVADAAPEAAAAPAATTKPAPAAAPAAARTTATRASGGQLPPVDEAGFARAHASPSVRRFARELGVDLGRVRGTGEKQRIRRDDIKAFVKDVMSGGGASAAPAWPAVPTVDFASFGPVDVQPLGRIQKISGPRLHASWVNVPHVTQHDEADTTDLELMRKKLKAVAAERDIKLTPLAFIVRACALALEEFPLVCSSLDASGENLVYKQYRHIGFAADTPNGLVVPVIRDADRKDVFEIAAELGEMSARARAGRLKSQEMQGGCFTISSLGGIGGTAFTPIVNAPEVAILGVSRSRMAPVWIDGEFQPRLMLPLSLSYDHRVVDGAAAVRFTTWLGALLADPERLVPAEEQTQ